MSGRRSGLALSLLAAGLLVGGCEEPSIEHLPDDVLRRELGLTDDDAVYTVRLTGGDAEVAEPALDTVPVGAWLQFVTTDWLVHEVAFDADGLSGAARAFLEAGDQMASPPLVQRDARFVVSLEGAPPGRYPYVLQGNGAPGRGAVIVVGADAR